MARDASPQTTKEYQVKAAFLFQFMQFVEWPEPALGDPSLPICIGVLGRDPFGPALEEVTRNEKAQNRPIVVRRSQNAGDLQDCHLVFVSSSEMPRAAQVIAAFGERPVLTVGDTHGFARQGGIMNFFLEGQRVRFEINAGEARQAGLRISSQLLGLGRPVESARGGGGE
jgi:hypothetical protein